MEFCCFHLQDVSLYYNERCPHRCVPPWSGNPSSFSPAAVAWEIEDGARSPGEGEGRGDCLDFPKFEIRLPKIIRFQSLTRRWIREACPHRASSPHFVISCRKYENRFEKWLFSRFFQKKKAPMREFCIKIGSNAVYKSKIGLFVSTWGVM